MPVRPLLLLLAIPALLATGLARAEPGRAGCGGATGADRIAGIGRGGEVRLASGRRLTLRDTRLPDDESGAGAASWLATLAGQEASVTAEENPDRWGRVVGDVALAERGGPVDLVEFLVREGWAVVDPGEQQGLCRPGLLAAEDGARRRGLGLWRGATLPVAATDVGRLRDLDGRFAVVEGQVVSVGERKSRTYLNFGRDFGRDFAVSIPRRTWAAMRTAGLSADDFRGRRVRVRGLVEVRRAPGLEIVVADLIERLDEAAPRARRGRGRGR